MPDIEIQLRALVGKATAMNTALAGSGTEWLVGVRDEALTAVLAGDQEVTSVAFEGANAGGARKFDAQHLLDLAQLAVERLGGTASADVVVASFGARPVRT